jgi:hypothetical protein
MIGERMRLVRRLRERLAPGDGGLSFHSYVSAHALIARRVRYLGGEARANESGAEKSLPAFA